MTAYDERAWPAIEMVERADRRTSTMVQTGIRGQMKDRRDWLDDALRRLGREILDEEVPERLRRVLRDRPAAPRDQPPDGDKRDPPPKPPRRDRRD